MKTEPAAAGGAVRSLYQKEAKIYPREVDGVFARWRLRAMTALLGLYYGVVWLRWDDRQAVLFDLPARKFHIFGLTLWPQDFIYLALLLLMLALTLFFVTAVAGRLWCGYACPQTVWTEAFLLIERWTEGPRHQRMKRDRGKWTRQRVARKSLKQGLWIGLSLWTGLTFVGYFTPVRALVADLAGFQAHPWAVFWVGFYGLATYGNAGFLREQVCKYMCPYARFQSAMFDKDTLIVAYDEARGEPRGKRRRGAESARDGLGDCIDCTLCVQACPTGIDIRHGLQYECIACAACIDACDGVMDKMGYRRGLIRYTTDHALHGRPTRTLRVRTVLYAALIAAIAGAMVWSLAHRTPLRMEVVRDRNALYRVVEDGLVENVYTLRIVNMRDAASVYRLSVSAELPIDLDAPPLVVDAGASAAFALRLRAAAAGPAAGHDVLLTLHAEDRPEVFVQRRTRFFLPEESVQ